MPGLEAHTRPTDGPGDGEDGALLPNDPPAGARVCAALNSCVMVNRCKAHPPAGSALGSLLLKQ